MPLVNAVGNSLTGQTGTGEFVGATAPALTTPELGTPDSGTLTNCIGLPISTGISGLASGMAAFLGTGTSADLSAALTDETGSGALVFSNSPSLVTPNLGTPNELILTNATGDQTGTTTNDNAAAGKVGQYISSSGGVSLTSTVISNVRSISLTAGDWTVSGSVSNIVDAGTTTTIFKIGINTTSATMPTLGAENNTNFINPVVTAGNTTMLPVGPMRLSLAATTTVYLVAQSTFAGGAMTAVGFIGARRVR